MDARQIFYVIGSDSEAEEEQRTRRQQPNGAAPHHIRSSSAPIRSGTVAPVLQPNSLRPYTGRATTVPVSVAVAAAHPPWLPCPLIRAPS
jgi:hypothetical protein